MKLVINRCYGGFGLSSAALKELVVRYCKAMRSTPASEWGSMLGDGLVDIGDGFQAYRFYDVILKGDTVYTYRSEERTDPDLVAVVESMGEASFGPHAKLAVVEIPDGVAYDIDDYDGVERVHETHRSWP